MILTDRAYWLYIEEGTKMPPYGFVSKAQMRAVFAKNPSAGRRMVNEARRHHAPVIRKPKPKPKR